jgi:hypothetical protein
VWLLAFCLVSSLFGADEFWENLKEGLFKYIFILNIFMLMIFFEINLIIFDENLNNLNDNQDDNLNFFKISPTLRPLPRN